MNTCSYSNAKVHGHVTTPGDVFLLEVYIVFLPDKKSNSQPSSGMSAKLLWLFFDIAARTNIHNSAFKTAEPDLL